MKMTILFRFINYFAFSLIPLSIGFLVCILEVGVVLVLEDGLGVAPAQGQGHVQPALRNYLTEEPPLFRHHLPSRPCFMIVKMIVTSPDKHPEHWAIVRSEYSIMLCGWGSHVLASCNHAYRTAGVVNVRRKGERPLPRIIDWDIQKPHPHLQHNTSIPRPMTYQLTTVKI